MPHISGLTLLLIPCTAILLGQTSIGSPKFHASSQMVLIPVTVVDHDGKTVEGLHAENFGILDNDRPQQIVSFAIEDAPCSAGLILDTSGSMRNTLGGVKEIARAFLGTANPEDEFLLLTVSTRPTELSEFTTDTRALEKEINSPRAEGMTALIDTIYFGLSRMRGGRHSRRALVILSDGIENYSRYSEADLMRAALEADVQIYSIIVDDRTAAGSTARVPFRPTLVIKSWDRGPERQGPEMLEKLSEKTGGLHFRVHNPTEAKSAMINTGRAIRDQYVIGYKPANSDESGKWHRVRVKTNARKVNVYARNGYYSR